MTVQSTSSKTTIAGNGAATVFTYPFVVPVATHLRVTYINAAGVSAILPASQYSVTGIGSATGGTVTYPLSGPAIATGTSLVIERVTPLQQSTALGNQAGYFPNVVEAALDNLEYQIQEVAGAVLNPRALTFPASDVNPVTELPPAAARANLILGFNGAGNPVAVAVPTPSASGFVSVFNYMTVAQIFSIQSRNFLVDVSTALAAAFAAGVGYMPAGGYLCSNSVAVSGAIANGIQIRGDGAAVTEMRFPAGRNGLSVAFSDAQTVPSVMGLTITTLNVGPAVANTGLNITMSPTVGTAYRQGPRISDVVVRGANPTLHGWSTSVMLDGLWYPAIDGLTVKGYSAVGAGLNHYETLHGIHFNATMAPFISRYIVQHIETGVLEDGVTLALEGFNMIQFEMVGVRSGVDIGGAIATGTPGSYIGAGHVNCSYRGLVLNNRLQMTVEGVSLYRTPSTTEAWIGIVAANCGGHVIAGPNGTIAGPPWHDSGENSFHDILFANLNQASVQPCVGILLSGTSNFNDIADLSDDYWSDAGYSWFPVVMSNSASDNTVNAYTIRSGPNTVTAGKVAYAGGFTGVRNRVNDVEATITTLTQNSATPSVDNALGGAFTTNNTVPTTITNLVGGYAGQVVEILVGDDNTTFANGANIVMACANTVIAKTNDTFKFRLYAAGVWHEQPRADHFAPFLGSGSFSYMYNLWGGFIRVPGAAGVASTTSYSEDASGNTIIRSDVSATPTWGLANYKTDALGVSQFFDKYRGTIAAPAAAVVNDYVYNGIARARNAAGTLKTVAATAVVLTKAESGNEFGSTYIHQVSKAGTGIIESFREDETGITMSLRFKELQGADVVAANNLTLGYAGNKFLITGNTQINLLDVTDWQAGSEVTLLFSGTPTVKNGTANSTVFHKILLAGAVDFVATAEDVLTLVLWADGIWRQKCVSVN